MERYLLLKQQTFIMRIGPLCAKEKHLSCTFPLLTAWPINTTKPCFKKIKLSRNTNLWHVLVKGYFSKTCSNDKTDSLERHKLNYSKGINAKKNLMANIG